MALTLELAIERPESKDLGELVRGYYTMMRVLGFDLGLTAQQALSPDRGALWFVNFIASRKQSDPKRFPPNQQFDYRDPAFVLKDYAHEADSPYREVFGFTDAMGLTAKKIIWARNTWFHFGADPTLEDLLEVAQYVREFAQAAGLKSLGQVVALLTRLQRIKTGQYRPQSPGQPVSSSPAVELTAEEPPAELVVSDDPPRPPIGGVWVGSIPDARYRITRTGDVIDPETFESLQARVGDSFAQKVKLWFAVPPRGGEAWVADDGAIGGWINEYPRLLGYLGDDPSDGAPRGFLLPHFYETRSGAIVDLESGDTLATDIASNVEPGTVLRVTTYGDVLVIDDAHGVETVATVAPENWFAGHLG